ncbi:hypothetical protein BLNAU_10865 [Blattamonas nauphoetae]|uniref:Protein kinase domain-containing protein n=1 Tax=Blattamonas nauphoetae TaxID=2049346 RepID=A0ABQ9XS14_9EUKA|nr:hypothetical protein BLNAU_10865 [Blattamonas nauphoetae]
MELSFDSGLFWTNGIGITSKSVELHGNKTWLTHRANVRNERNDNSDVSTIQPTTTHNHPERWMMEVQNSSLTMRLFGLDAGMSGTTICLVVGSSVEVIDSQILSNMECSGFVLADSVGSGSSRIVIVGSSHKSSTLNVVLPLVGREYGHLNMNNEEWKGGEEGCGDGYVEREEIIGVGLLFDSTHFTLGTGPLFSFVGKSLKSGSVTETVGEISTELRSSSLLNVTCSYGAESRKIVGVGSCVWERVVGSEISRSTNHDMGTGLCGTRLNGNIACVNSSFTSCVRTSNDEIDIEHTNITYRQTGRTGVYSWSGITSVKFTLCTFSDMSAYGGSGTYGGSAIALFKSSSSLTVTQCFFHKCVCEGPLDTGGAIFVNESRADCPVSLSSSSFAECANTHLFGNYGGSLYSLSNSSISISDCFFENSTSTDIDGALSLREHSLATLSNCAFVNCIASTQGGAMGVRSVKSIDFSFLQFRRCSSGYSSKDIFFQSMSDSLVNADTVKFCDSTSGTPNLNPNYGGLNPVVPQISSTPTVTVDVSFSGEIATVTATANPAVKGTMGILLDGSNVPRLVYLQFGSSTLTSTIGSTEVSSGANGVLPQAEYELRALSIPSNYLSSLKVSSAQSTLKDGNTAAIVLRGVNLGKGSYSMLIQNGGPTFNISLTRFNSTTLVGSAPLHPLDALGRLEWSTEYEVLKVMWLPNGGIEENVRLIDSVILTTPTPPSFTKVEFSFTNSLGTGCIAILTGTDLVVGTEYTVTLNTLHAIKVVVKSSTRAESSEMPIGFEGALAYSADILVETVNPTDEASGIVKMPSPVTGQTPARPNVNEIFVDTETGQMDETCGDLSRPCSTMDAAWKIMRRLKISQLSFSLLKGTSLSSQMTIDSGMSVLIHNGAIHEPTLNIPSTAAESATSALIVVSSALLNIQNIDIVVGSSQSSFVLISASSSEMILKDGLITIESESGRSGNEMEELCLWTTGLIELIDSELNVTNNQFFNISQGVIRMKGGKVKIEGSIFRDNIPSNSSFPSARRNIACSDEGKIHIGSLAAGDGTILHPSAWISSEGCSIESTEMNAASPLFIPTLSSDSTSKLDKKTKSFSLTIEGTILIPCSLFLKVVEVGKDGIEVNSTLIPLTIDSATSFTETKIVVTLPSLSLNSLDDSLEWRGRLVFGENETTTDSFLILQSSSDRLAQSMKDNMKWWIPLVVIVSCALLALILIVVLLMRRRNKNKAEKGENDGERQELDHTEDKIEVLEADNDNNDNRNSVHTAGQKQLFGNPTISKHSSQPLRDTNMIIPAPTDQTAVLIVGEDEFGRPKIEDGFVNKRDTLFNRLHRRKQPSGLNIYRTRLDVAKAVAKLILLRPNAVALRKLNPHWVLLTPSNSICFRLNDDTPSQAPTTIPTQSGPQKETQEDNRWSAPEEENRSNGIDEQKVTVFRLGLLLWEITTGQVPFSETDAVNAQRQLGMGIVPGMESVDPAELSTLLLECLNLDPLSRPSVESIVSRLESIGEGKKEEARGLRDLPNHPHEPPPESQNRN